jgi:hypothetical protein
MYLMYGVCDNNGSPTGKFLNEITYGGYAYQHGRYIASKLGYLASPPSDLGSGSWAYDRMSLLEHWWTDHPYNPIAEPFFWNGNTAYSSYPEIQAVTVLQRIQAYHKYNGSVPREFVDALYSAAFDGSYGTDDYGVSDCGYAPEGFAANGGVVGVGAGAQNLHMFYAVHGILLAGDMPDIVWAWDGVADSIFPPAIDADSLNISTPISAGNLVGVLSGDPMTVATSITPANMGGYIQGDSMTIPTVLTWGDLQVFQGAGSIRSPGGEIAILDALGRPITVKYA